MSGTGTPSVTTVSRWGRAHPRVVDAIVAMAWLLLATPTLLIATAEPAVEPAVVVLIVVVVLVVAAVLVVLRRRRPVLAFIVCAAANLPLVVFDPGLGTLAAAFCIYAIAVYDSARRAWIAAAVAVVIAAAVIIVALLIGAPFLVVELDSTTAAIVLYAISGILTILVGLFWGLNAGGRKRYIDQLIAHATALEHERDQQAQLAALAERSRIARDVHDIVSHSLSVIVRLADGADAVLEQDPQRARAAVADLATVARSSLGEMRRVMGVLERTPSADTVPSGAGLDDLPRLIEVFRSVGLPVGFEIVAAASGEPGVQMTVFRVVQESLTNALRHAVHPTEVTVEVVADRDVTVTVVNDGVPDGEPSADRVGRGLVGMRERAALYGGTLDAGLDDAGRWRVRLELPGALR